MRNTQIDRLCFMKRREGYDVDRPRHPFLRRSTERFQPAEAEEIATKSHSASDYTDAATPGPWIVEWEELPDGRTVYWIDGEQSGRDHWKGHNANVALMESVHDLRRCSETGRSAMALLLRSRGISDEERQVCAILEREFAGTLLRAVRADVEALRRLVGDDDERL